jgi:hypothetical protein
MSNARHPMPTVEVVEPITVRTIGWRRGARHRPPVAVGVNLTYHFRDPNSEIKVAGQPVVADVCGGPFGIDSTLALANHVPEDLLVKFLALWERPTVAKALRELDGDPKRSPVVLEAGLLAGLLKFGITPDETWTFLLNHGAARRKSLALLNPSGPPEVRTYDPWADATKKRNLLNKTITHCSETARSLRKLQSVDVSAALMALGSAKSFQRGDVENPELGPIDASETFRLGPLPAWPPERTERIITELEQLAIQLKKYLPYFQQPRNRVANPDGPRFCRDWYDVATERAKNPLYAYGATLYSLLFRKVTKASFTELCRRARRATELTKKD